MSRDCKIAFSFLLNWWMWKHLITLVVVHMVAIYTWNVQWAAIKFSSCQPSTCQDIYNVTKSDLCNIFIFVISIYFLCYVVFFGSFMNWPVVPIWLLMRYVLLHYTSLLNSVNLIQVIDTQAFYFCHYMKGNEHHVTLGEGLGLKRFLWTARKASNVVCKKDSRC